MAMRYFGRIQTLGEQCLLGISLIKRMPRVVWMQIQGYVVIIVSDYYQLIIAG